MSTGSASNLDDVLGRLAEVIRGSATSGSETSPSPPQPTQPNADSTPASPNAGADFIAFQEQFGRELASQSLIPPISPDALQTMDQAFSILPELLKTKDKRPYLASLINNAASVAAAGQQIGDERTTSVLQLLLALLRGGGSTGPMVRSFGSRNESHSRSNAELLAVLERIQTDVLGENGDRAVPVIFFYLAATAGGATVGMAIGEIIAKLK